VSEEDLLADVLARLERRSGIDRNGWYTALCPYHPDREHPIRRINKKGFRCMACGTKGSLRTLAGKLGICLRRPPVGAR
jgi:hypothetical protein